MATTNVHNRHKVGDGSFDAQEKCLRDRDQAYTKVGAVPALATWVYEDTNIYMPSAQQSEHH